MIVRKILRVAYIDYGLEPDKPGRSGLSDVVWDMASELVNQGHEAHIIASYHNNIYPDSRIIVHNFPTPPIGYRNVIGRLWILKRAADIAKKHNYDIIHAPEYVSIAVFSMLGIKTPLVFTTPGNIFERLSNVNHFDWTATALYKWAARISAKKSTCIDATSKEMKYWWKYSGASDDQIKVIPLGVNTKLFTKRLNSKKRLGLDDSYSILFVGRLQRENNLEQLIRAAQSVFQILKSVKLDIVGEGEQENYLRELSKQLGIADRVRWHGRVQLDLLPLYYSAANVFVCPRLSRVTPRVLFEAMACQTPVIASSIGGIVDFIEDGKTGLLFDPKKHDLLVEIILKLLTDTEFAENIGINGRSYTVNYLDWQIITKRIIEDIYFPIVS